MIVQIQLTEDGSHTLHSQEYGSTYHSRFGAIQESNAVFIQAGLRYILEKRSYRPGESIHILEMGLGSGLNAWLSYIESLEKNVSIEYIALEKYPLPMDVVNLLNYPAEYHPDLAESFLAIHQSDCSKSVHLAPGFRFLKQCMDVAEWQPESEKFHLVFYDAFGPSAQPELWTEQALEPFVNTLQTGGVFVTYCAKGEVRRTLERLGLKMERLPGPPGKREMLRGTKR